MKAVVLTFDRLPLGFLGCYGNSQAATSHFDRLAAASVVFDQHYAENVDPCAAVHAWRTGCFHFPRADADASSFPDVAETLSRHGVETTVIRESGSRTPLPASRQTIDVDGREGLDVLADEAPFAQLVSHAESLIASWQPDDDAPRLLWLHSCGIPSHWRPPREFARAALRRQLGEVVEEPAAPDDDLPETMADPAAADRGDAEPPNDEAVEEIVLEDLPDEQFDEFVDALIAAAANESSAAELTFDEWQVARTICAGYVELIDLMLGRLLSALECRLDGEPLLFIVTAAAGVAAGERVMASLPATALPEEIVHTPLIVRAPGCEPGTRRQNLVQTVDLVPTLLEWFAASPDEVACEGQSLLPAVTGQDARPRDFICLGDGRAWAGIRTPEWYLVGSIDGGPPPRLFVKPDDVWEAHELSAQSPDEVDRLAEALAQFMQCAAGS